MSSGGEGAASFPAPTTGRGPVATDRRSCAAPLDPNHRPSYAEALFEIARLVEASLPMPAIQSSPTGELVVSVAREDLLEWVIRFDLPGPEWECEQHGDVIYRAARWPRGTFDALLFRIICLDTVPVNPNADDATCATRCQDCAAFGLPGCALSMGARS